MVGSARTADQISQWLTRLVGGARSLVANHRQIMAIEWLPSSLHVVATPPAISGGVKLCEQANQCAAIAALRTSHQPKVHDRERLRTDYAPSPYSSQPNASS